jgi:hypothetical protein
MPKTEKPKGRTSNPLIEVTHPKQLLVVQKLAEIVRKSGRKQKKISMGRLMREAGYSVNFSKKPSVLVESDNFQRLLEKHLPDTLLTSTHGQLIKASRLGSYVFKGSQKDDEIRQVIEKVEGCELIRIATYKENGKLKKRAYFKAPDNQTRQRAISEAYRLKNKYPIEQQDNRVAIVNVIKYG